MVNFFLNLPQTFRDRYLNTHETYLSSISSLVRYFRGGKNEEEFCRNIMKSLPRREHFPISIPDNPDEESLHFRHLRNAWYHECALRYPSDLDSTIMFGAWKIVQCYYTVFASIGALVRSIRNNADRMGHGQTINIYAQEVLTSKKFYRFFLPPANNFLDQQGNLSNEELLQRWEYARTYHIPIMKKCLASVRTTPSLTTFVHYLKNLREWATYEDSYLFFRMYGPTVKQNLDTYLQDISFFYLAQTELFLIRACGWEAMNLQFETFVSELQNNMKLDAPTLTARFSAYRSI